MIVEILKTDKRLGLRKGHRYAGNPYELDPETKITLLYRISREGRRFKRDPMCNVYRSEVKILRDGIILNMEQINDLIKSFEE